MQGAIAEAQGPDSLLEEPLTAAIIGAAIEVHRILGPGLLESVYEECMREELRARRIPFTCQTELPVIYKGKCLPGAFYRIDLVVADAVIVEMKSVEKVSPAHVSQLLTYMRLTGKKVGLIINFNVGLLRNGIVRRVL